MSNKEIVRQGYDKVSYAYRNENQSEGFSDYAAWLAELALLLPPQAKVLDLGCGCGVPAAQTLAQQFSVVGVDISPVQIERARNIVPNAEFICADMTEVDFPAESFAAIISLYAIIHIPLDEQPTMFAKFFKLLQPEGYLLVIVGSRAWTGVEENWLDVSGATMFWSHADAETYQSWLTEIGFKLRWSKFIAEGNGGHQLIFAQKPKEKCRESEGAIEQIIGREGETATFLSRCPLNLELRGFGFAPRQLNRSMPLGEIKAYVIDRRK